MNEIAAGCDCFVAEASEATKAHPLYALRPGDLATFRPGSPEARFLAAMGFAARAGELVVGPAEGGLFAALGLGEDRSPFVFGGLAAALPEGTLWRLAEPLPDPAAAVLGFALGAYRIRGFREAGRRPVRLALPASLPRAPLVEAETIWMVRDLINAPPNVLGPAELAEAAALLAAKYGAAVERLEGEALARDYPAVALVGGSSPRAPIVARIRWRGSNAGAEAPLVALCGKGVCFDTGGLDVKPAAGMRRMKKDMGGAAAALGLARLLMEADLPLRLSLRLGCVENAISGAAMRPLDVIRTHQGLSVEVGHTDAEGRLVLCDLLAEAAHEKPALLLDFATLTGAARVALGPDVPALFATDDAWAEAFLAAGSRVHDPLWRLPLWSGYEGWLQSSIADVATVAQKPQAGAIIAALFLNRFVPQGIPWVHVDLYAWNDESRPGRPEGGEAQAIRASFAAIRRRLNV